MRWNELDEEVCSIARTVAIIGDRWTVLILRECFLGIARFDDFEARLKISRRTLNERLQKLLEGGVLIKVPYQKSPVRLEYQLTPKGRQLYPILRMIQFWGDTHLSGPEGRPSFVVHDCGRASDPVVTCSECGEPLGDGHGARAYKGPGGAKNRHLSSLPEASGADASGVVE